MKEGVYVSNSWDISTEDLEAKYMTCESMSACKKFVNDIEEKEFKDYFSELMKKKKIKVDDMLKSGGIKRQYVYAIKNGEKKPRRDYVLKLAVAIGADVLETNRMLKLAGFSELYVKSQKDAIILFGIRKKKKSYEIDELLIEN